MTIWVIEIVNQRGLSASDSEEEPEGTAAFGPLIGASGCQLCCRVLTGSF